MKKLLTLILALSMALALCGCGGGGETAEPTESTEVEAAEQAVTEAPAEEDAASNAEPTVVALGGTMTQEFVEMTFTDTGVAEDITQSITVGNVTRVTGPQPEAGMSFIYLQGTIKNLHTEELPVYDFFIGEFLLDEYAYAASANECDILTPNGEPVSMIAPLTTYNYTIAVPVPNELAAAYQTASFTFGFYDLFDNEELSYNMAFAEDPIAECPYQYTIQLKG